MTELKLTNGLVAIIDDEDYELCSYQNWHCMNGMTISTQYAYFWNPYPNANLLHRYLFEPLLKGQIVHHKNKNGLDCRKSNLKITTNSFNQHARTDVKGYHRENSRGCYKAMISIDGKAIFLGRFNDESDAALAYQLAKQNFYPELFGKE